MGPMDAYTDQEADRLSNIMANDPHFAANELRNQLQQLDPQSASVLIAKTKYDETNKAIAYGPGLGDLQIQPELNQYGQDTGWRNVTMATPDSVEQIAEVQARPPVYGEYGYGQGAYGAATLGFAAGIIVGDLAWNQARGVDFNSGIYLGWCNREQMRENYWNNPQNLQNYQQNWGNPQYRAQFQTQQNWQNINQSTHVNNTYVTNNRYDTTIVNRPVSTTVINETINNTKQTYVNAPHTTIMNNIRQNTVNNNPRADVHSAAPVVGRPASAAGSGEHVQWQQPATQNRPLAGGQERTAPAAAERTVPAAQQPQHVQERQTGPSLQQQQEQARENAARQAAEANTARQAAEANARQAAEANARQAAETKARENSAPRPAATEQRAPQQVHEPAPAAKIVPPKTK